MVKFMQQLNDPIYRKLRRLAKERNIGVQELLRSIVIPDYVNAQTRNGQKPAQPDKSVSREKQE